MMNFPTLQSMAIIGLLCASLSLVFVRLVIGLARRRGMLDFPGERQSHSEVTLTGGGLGLVGALCLASLILWRFGVMDTAWVNAVVPGLAVLSFMGWKDDFRPLSNVIRLAVQFSVSIAMLVFLHGSGLVQVWWFHPVLATLLVGVMNMYNFMDGSHGMAGFQGVFAGAMLAALFLASGNPGLAAAAIVVAACCAGFLPWNFPAPKVFMGDAGSVPLGFALAALLVIGWAGGYFPVPIAAMVLAVFLVDSALTLMRRVFAGERWYTAHRKHVYQRLIAKGWPHSRVLLLYQAINIMFVAPAIALGTMYPEYAWHMAGFLYVLLVAGWYSASLRLEVRT